MKNINVLFEDAKAILEDLNIPYGNIVSVTASGKMTSTFGTCRYSRKTQTYSIKLSRRLLEDSVPYEVALDTMVHELLHAYKGRMCHTGDWKVCANKVNANYPQIHIQRCATAEEMKAAPSVRRIKKYRVYCADCGYKYDYSKKGPVVKIFLANPNSKRCSCGKCGSHNLKLTTLQ